MKEIAVLLGLAENSSKDAIVAKLKEILSINPDAVLLVDAQKQIHILQQNNDRLTAELNQAVEDLLQKTTEFNDMFSLLSEENNDLLLKLEKAKPGTELVIVEPLTDEELKAKAIDVLKRHPYVDKVFVTIDGVVFLKDKDAESHKKLIGGEVLPFNRE